MNNEEYDIILPPDIKLHRVYDFLPYTHWRIKQILQDYFNAYLVRQRAYKEGRYAGYKQRYNIYDISTGKLIRSNIHLDDLRHFFASKDFPLHEDNKRNPMAQYFLSVVNTIAEEQSKSQEGENV